MQGPLLQVRQGTCSLRDNCCLEAIAPGPRAKPRQHLATAESACRQDTHAQHTCGAVRLFNLSEMTTNAVR